MKKNILPLYILLFMLPCMAFAQAKQKVAAVDSLENALKNNTDTRLQLHKTTYDKSDTTRVDILNNLCREYINKSNEKKAKMLFEEALQIAVNIGYKKGEGNAYNNMGILYLNQGNYPLASKNFSTAQRIAEQAGNKNGVANSLNNLAVIYNIEGNFPEALKAHLASLKIREEMNDKKGMATSYNNIGIVNNHLGNKDEALKNYTAAFKIRQEIGDKQGLINSYTNFGNFYDEKNDYEKALENFFAGLKLCEELGNKRELASTYMNIGIAYRHKGNDGEALKYYLDAMKIHQAIGDKYGFIKNLINISILHKSQKNYGEARKYLDSALVLSKQIGANLLTRNTYESLSTLDSITGNWQNAYVNHMYFIAYRDSLINSENDKKLVETQMQYEFNKKEDSSKSAQEKKDLAYEKEIALKALQFEYQQKQAAAKSEEERRQLKYEQQIKEQQIAYEYNQKIIKAETVQKNQLAANKVLLAENNLMQQKTDDERKMRWLMIAALIGFTAFGINYYRNYVIQKANNKKIIKQAEDLKVLMREVHHRVKNNLQIIVAMLRMQARNVTDKSALEALVNSENRLEAIAIVHEKLYKGDTYNNVSLKDYLQELMDVLAKQHIGYTTPFDYKITDNANLVTNLDTAIPLGLIVNELVTNSFKYAFDNNTKGEINIELQKVNKAYELTIQDNGQGLKDGQLPKNPKSLGLRLVQLFTEQLNGTLKYATSNGARYTVVFA